MSELPATHKPSALLRRAAARQGRDPQEMIRIATQAHAMLLLDTSSSMRGVNINQAKSGAKGWATHAIGEGYKVGLVTFDAQATEVVPLTDNLEELTQAIEPVQAQSSTNLAAAIAIAVDRMRDLTGSRVIFIVTDGLPNNEQDTVTQAETAKQLGIRIETTGVDGANLDLLKRLSTDASRAEIVPKASLGRSMTNAAKLLPPASGGSRKRLG